jgi:site-specific DNA-methyltransferase (adenine-specific)
LTALGKPNGQAPVAPDVDIVCISGKEFPYIRRWTGQSLLPADSSYLAFDTETEVVDLNREIPRLALACASTSDRASCLIHPDDIGSFILAHQSLQFVCHHTAFDFWVVEQHLRKRGEDQALSAWWEIVESNRLHDSMLLDMLVRLAIDDEFPRPRNLAVVAKEYANLDISKEDPYRLRYVEIIDKDWSSIESGFFEYAIKDPIVTRLAYLELQHQARRLLDRFGGRGKDIFDDAVLRFGLLSEAVQVKKAIALAQITRNGMCIDRTWASRVEAELRRRLDQTVANVRTVCPQLYKTDAAGNLVCDGKARTPSKNTKALAAQLEGIAEEIKQARGVGPSIPLTNKTRRLSTSRQHWEEYADHHPFLRHWMEAEELAKLLQFFTRLREDRVHPTYTTMVRTGRTSCANPNVQQIPRDGDFRQAFVASPGHFLLAVDYSAIELRTLAAVCWQRYGQSALADLLKQSRDPHEYTAAMMLGVPVDEFGQWKKNETLKDQYVRARQAAKAVNFGVPGGLGAQRLMEYAKSTYHVDMTLEEARQRRERLTTVYKELDSYLAEDAVAIVARNLQAQVKDARNELGDLHLTCVRKILEGNPKKSDGTPYRPSFVDRVWESLARLNRNPDVKEALETRQPGEALAKRVCQAGVATLTGRIRGRVKYSQARNTPFQGLAADSAALALFELIKEGFRIVGFIHDENLVEMPDEGGYVSEATVNRVREIMCRAMESVLAGGIPVDCEAALSTCWSKGAKLIVRNGTVFPWEADAVEGRLDDPKEDSQPVQCVVPDAVSPSDACCTPRKYPLMSDAVGQANIAGTSGTVALQPIFCLADPAAELYVGDCRNTLPGLPIESVDLVVSDPPYNIGLHYHNQYDDAQQTKDFLALLEEAFSQAHRLLKPTGSLFLFMGCWLQAEALVLLKKLGFHYRRTIAWYNTFGQAQQNNFTPSWTAIHYVTKHHHEFTFNADAIRVPSARQLRYNDKRANPKGKLPDDVWVLLPEIQAPDCFNPDSDLWLQSRVCGTFKERVDHVTQLPLPLVERIIKVASNPGDLVLDPFAGSGTILVGCRRLRRRSIGIELSSTTAVIAGERLERLEKS